MRSLPESHDPGGGSASLGDPIGLFHTWWRGDPLPGFSAFPNLAMGRTDDVMLIAGMSGIDISVIWERMRRRHQLWLARIDGVPVAYGWTASGDLSIGELGLDVVLEPTCRYLWDFQTLPAWRGGGIYPRLLQAIVAHDQEAERFWVGHDLDNISSARGIAKAGFRQVGAVYRTAGDELAMMPSGSIEHAAAASAQFGIRLVEHSSVVIG